MVQGSNPCGPTIHKPFKTKGLKAKKCAAVDTSPTAMNPTGDKLATTQETQAVEDFCRRSNGGKLGVKVPQVVAEAIEAKERDGMSAQYLSQLRSILGLFSRAFTGPILD